MRAVAVEVKDLVAEYGGVNSSEHGDGLARSEFNREIFGDDLYEAMREVKGLFDPDNVHEPRQDRRRAGDDRQPARRGAAAGPARCAPSWSSTSSAGCAARPTAA